MPLVFRCIAVLSLYALLAVTVQSGFPPVDSLPSARSVALIGVNVIPMDQPGIKHDQTVIVRNGTVVSLGPALRTAVPKNAQRIEAVGTYLIPGLVDSHVHLQQSANTNRAFLDLFLANGVTTILNLYGTPTHLSLRENVRLGRILGPRIFTSGPSLGDPVGETPTTTAEEVLEAVRAQKRAGYDFVKLHGDLSRAAYHQLVQATREENIPLIGHAPRNLGIDAILQERQHAVAHVEEYLYAYFYYHQDMRTPLPDLRNKIRILASETATAGTWVISTLVVYRGIAEQISDLNAVLRRPEVRYVPPTVGEALGWWPPHNTYVNRFPKATVPEFQAHYQLLEQTTRAFQESRVPLLAGTDTPTSAVVPGFSLHDELQALVAAGLTPYQALQTATTNPAQFLGAATTIGTIQVGQQADLVLLQRNPLTDIANTSTVIGVMTHGRWISKTDRKALLQEALKLRDQE